MLNNVFNRFLFLLLFLFFQVNTFFKPLDSDLSHGIVLVNLNDFSSIFQKVQQFSLQKSENNLKPPLIESI